MLYTRQHSHSSQWLIYRRHPIYTAAERADGACAHVDLRQITSTAKHGHHISVPDMVVAQGRGRASNITGQVQDHTVCQGDRMGVEGRNAEFCLLKHPGHYGLLITLNIHECHF